MMMSMSRRLISRWQAIDAVNRLLGDYSDNYSIAAFHDWHDDDVIYNDKFALVYDYLNQMDVVITRSRQASHMNSNRGLRMLGQFIFECQNKQSG